MKTTNTIISITIFAFLASNSYADDMLTVENLQRSSFVADEPLLITAKTTNKKKRKIKKSSKVIKNKKRIKRSQKRKARIQQYKRSGKSRFRYLKKGLKISCVKQKRSLDLCKKSTKKKSCKKIQKALKACVSEKKEEERSKE
jgi:hypothetical protein